MNEIKIFILIPVYNVEKYLEECLESILNQDYSNYEVILVDDGSTDTSGVICDRYAAEDTRFHVIHKENGGVLRARLTAIDFVRRNREIEGTYCIFVDSDDKLADGALKTIHKKIMESSCELLIYGREKFNDNGVFCSTLDENIEEMLIVDLDVLFREGFIKHTYHDLWRKALKTELLFYEIEEQFQSIQMGEDLIQSVEIYKNNPRTWITPVILYRYRANPASITHVFKMKRFLEDMSAKRYAVTQIRALNIWDDNDFQKYLELCIQLVARDIKEILQESGSKEKAIENLEILYAHPFIQEFCLESITSKSNVWLREFKKRNYGVLICLNKLWQIKKALKR